MNARAVLRIATVLLLVVAPAALLLLPLPGRIETPLVPIDEDGEPMPVLLDIRQVTPTLKEASAILSFPDAAVLMRHQQLELKTATYGGDVDLILADASVEGTNCNFVADPRQGLPNNGRLVLSRSRSCTFLQGSPTNRVLLRIAYNGMKGIALWTRVPKDGRVHAVPRVSYPPVVFANTEGMLEGALVSEGGPSYNRAQLLAYLWRGTTSSGWLWMSLAAAALVFGLGVWKIESRPTAAPFALALALGTIYAIVTPPLQAPDEPTHLLTFARITNQEHVIDEAGRWAWATHFQRIRFNPGEQFRGSDVGSPLLINWTLVSVQDASRSAAASRLWRTLAALLPAMGAASWLLALRLVGALGLALAIAAVSRAAAGPDGSATVNPALPLLLVPTLLFFGMHASNHALLAWAYVLIAGGVALGVWRPDRGFAAALLLGAGQALAISAGRIGLAVLPMTAAAVAGWLRLNRESRGRFLLGLAAGSLVLPIAAGPDYLARLAEPLRASTSMVITAGIAGALIAGVTLGLLTRRWSSAKSISRAAMVLAAVPPLMLLSSLAIDLPRVQSATATSLGAYVATAIAAVVTFPRLRGADVLSSDSFWGGFGWLDTYPPAALMTVLVVVTALSVTGWLWRMWQRPDPREWGWTLVVGGGFLASLVLLAAGAYLYAPELHGRYLLGIYLPALAIIWAPFSQPRRRPLLVAACAAIHGGGLATILLRYF